MIFGETVVEQQHLIAGFGAVSIVTLVWQVIRYVVDALEKREDKRIASEEKIALAKIAVENEKDKSTLKQQVAVLTIETQHCKDGHVDTKEQLKKCKESHIEGSLDRSKIWAEIKVAKDEAATAKELANGLTTKLAASSLAQGTAEGTAIGLAQGHAEAAIGGRRATDRIPTMDVTPLTKMAAEVHEVHEIIVPTKNTDSPGNEK